MTPRQFEGLAARVKVPEVDSKGIGCSSIKQSERRTGIDESSNVPCLGAVRDAYRERRSQDGKN